MEPLWNSKRQNQQRGRCILIQRSRKIPQMRCIYMIYTPLIKRALELCYECHKGQYDKGGTPYVFHPYHLAEQMDNEDEIIVALLHDTIEDSDITLEQLKKENFNSNVIQALDVLTHRPNTPYDHYITRVLTNNTAVKIKKADLIHNLDETRLTKKTDNKNNTLKYQMALERLTTEGPITIKIKTPVKERSLALTEHGYSCFKNQIIINDLSRPIIIIFPEWVELVTYGYVEGLVKTWLKKYTKETILEKVTFIIDKHPSSDVPKDIQHSISIIKPEELI